MEIIYVLKLTKQIWGLFPFIFTMEKEKHKLRHIKLHKMLDELIADFIRHTNKMPSTTTLHDLMVWSYEQTIEPKE